MLFQDSMEHQPSKLEPNSTQEVSDPFLNTAIRLAKHPDILARLLERLISTHIQHSVSRDRERLLDSAEMLLSTSLVPAERALVEAVEQARSLTQSGNLLAWKFERTGILEDLEKAIIRLQMGLAATSPQHPDYAKRLSNLGTWLGRKFERTGAIEDLEQAISFSTQAVELTADHHPNRATRLSSLGSLLARRHERHGSMEDLEQAIRRAQEAVALTHWRHPKRASYLNGLGNAWAWKYRRTKDPADICQAIFYLELAIDFSPPNLPDRLSWLSNLGTISSWRYEQTGALSDLEYAISRTEQAMKTMPDNHPNRALSHSSLGDLLCCRHDRTRRRLDIEGSLRHYKSSWGFVNAPPVVRIKAAHKAGGILLSLDGWQESSELLQQAVHLLQSISAGNLQQQDQQHMLGEFAGLATLAASAALQAGRGPIHTLRLLELGRGVMAGLRFGSHRDALSPRKRLPELPERLGQGQDSPNSTSSRQLTVNVRETSQQCCKTEGANQMRTIRQSVRSTSLLLSPTEIELQSAASNGPIVVINTSPARCDALLVSNDGVRSIHLHGLRYVDIVEKAQLLHSLKVVRAASSPSEEIVRRSSDHMVQILEWLWLAAASPILAELGYRGPPRQGDNWPRTWWIPTGLLSLLPLHAAGRHGAAGGGTDTVIDRVISSYSPSLRALLHTQQRPRDDYRIPPRDALLVSMETTPDCSSLHKVGAEVTAVTRFLSSGLCLKRPTVMQQPRKEQVLAGLKSCDIFHFAGHAMSDPADPSKSHLLLQDWQQDPLTVQDLTELDRGGIENPHPPFLAYLSACSTGIMSPAESRLYDESITLMTACQMAGFRHTVGSLWDVCDDDHSVETASEFYKALGREFETLEDSAVALGVHSAARHIRDMTRGNSCFFSEQGDPFAWAAFIHMGP